MDAARTGVYGQRTMLKAIRLLSLLLILVLGGIWSWAWLGRDAGETLADSFARRLAAVTGQDGALPSAGGVQLPQGMVLGGPFSLVNHEGRPVTEQSFAGRFLLLFFGYSYCPDVCPTELGVIATAMDELGPAAARVTPVFVSVDPERDTPAQLADYVSRFHPALVGLTGTPEQVAAAARAYRVYYAKVNRPDMSQYLMDHSSFIYLVGPDGRVRALFRPETPPEAIAQAVRGQLRGG
ncbi:SCO family protein [Falsiroseomonas sp. HW251]|uniref:SCO family protein n=1 Tax=Falsiroseomonas sp. HW251 TaxID=3390998 RepID=UPI003D31B001